MNESSRRIVLSALAFLLFLAYFPAGVSAQTVTATVPVGAQPLFLAYDSGKGEVFVANFNDSTVSVISDSSNTVTATVSVGTNPVGVAYDSGKGEVFVANSSDNTVSVISDPTLTLAPNSGPSSTSTTLSGSSYLSSHTYSYCFESGVTSSPTTCSSTNQFTSDGSGNIPGSITLTMSGRTGLVVVSDPSASTVSSSATFTITSTPPPPPDPIMQCEYGSGSCHTSFIVFNVTESGKPAGGARVTLTSGASVTQIQITPLSPPTSPLCTNTAWASEWGKYWGCIAGETGQFITTPGVVYTYSITLASGALLKGTLIGPPPWKVEVVNSGA